MKVRQFARDRYSHRRAPCRCATPANECKCRFAGAQCAALLTHSHRSSIVDRDTNNNRFLSVATHWLRLLLIRQAEQHSIQDSTISEDQLQQAADAITAASTLTPPPAFTSLSQRLGLSLLEQYLLLLCVAMELDATIAQLCAQAQADVNRPYPTFSLALSLFDEQGWHILSPRRPLRHWHLIEISQPSDRPLTTSPIRADERIVSYLKGVNYLDDRIHPFLQPLASSHNSVALPPSQQTAVDAIYHHLTHAASDRPLPIIQLTGIDSDSKQLVARHAATALGLQLYHLPAHLLPKQTKDLETFARLWQRESLLTPVALYLDAHELNTENPSEGPLLLIQQFFSRGNGVFFLNTRDVWTGLGHDSYPLDIGKPTQAEQTAAWQTALGPNCNGYDTDHLTAQFNLGVAGIDHIVKSTLNATTSTETAVMHQQLWQACLIHTRPRMDTLAQRITPKATWQELVLPEKELDLLRRLAEQMKHRTTVYETWGFRRRSSRGLGMTVLFAGESGTGKTLSAEILANHLNLNLYRIDLSAVVSKYIGETEKNLRRLFDAAEDGGAVLFFDEADALFGKRSQVKDSHDRYANIEVNYLLQRMEAFQGLAILATNLKSGLDDAFMRRLRFVVTFQFPNETYRERIWKHIFPPETPLGNLDYRRLSRFQLAGGSIYNIALNAAFAAAADGTAVKMPHVLGATRVEFSKQDRLLNERDFIWEGDNE